MKHTPEEKPTPKPQFEWFIPITAFLLSGWIVAAYFAFTPGYNKMMSELPHGTVLNIVSPSIWLVIAVVLNTVAWMGACFVYIDPQPTEVEQQ